MGSASALPIGFSVWVLALAHLNGLWVGIFKRNRPFSPKLLFIKVFHHSNPYNSWTTKAGTGGTWDWGWPELYRKVLFKKQNKSSPTTNRPKFHWNQIVMMYIYRFKWVLGFLASLIHFLLCLFFSDHCFWSTANVVNLKTFTHKIFSNVKQYSLSLL